MFWVKQQRQLNALCWCREGVVVWVQEWVQDMSDIRQPHPARFRNQIGRSLWGRVLAALGPDHLESLATGDRTGGQSMV